jgi:hypothetical protein
MAGSSSPQFESSARAASVSISIRSASLKAGKTPARPALVKTSVF